MDEDSNNSLNNENLEDEDTGSTINSEISTGKKKKRKLNSEYWNFFSYDLETKKATCNIGDCRKEIILKNGTKTGPNQLKSHIKTSHFEEYNKIENESISYNYEICIKLYRKFIVSTNQPLTIKDNQYFEQFINNLNNNFQIPCYNTLYKLMEKDLLDMKENLKKREF